LVLTSIGNESIDDVETWVLILTGVGIDGIDDDNILVFIDIFLAQYWWRLALLNIDTCCFWPMCIRSNITITDAIVNKFKIVLSIVVYLQIHTIVGVSITESELEFSNKRIQN
jgi:hypothetical protein